MKALADGKHFDRVDFGRDTNYGAHVKTFICIAAAVLLTGSTAFGQSCVTTQTLGGSYRTTCTDGSSATHSQNLGGGVTTRYGDGGYSTTSRSLGGNVTTNFYSGGNAASSGAGTAYNNFYGDGATFDGSGSSFDGNSFFGN